MQLSGLIKVLEVSAKKTLILGLGIITGEGQFGSTYSICYFDRWRWYIGISHHLFRRSTRGWEKMWLQLSVDSLKNEDISLSTSIRMEMD